MIEKELYSTIKRVMPIPTADMLVRDMQGNFLLLKRSKKSEFGNNWWIPGGHIEFKESPIDCAVRELEEETGLKRHNIGHIKLLEVMSHKFPDKFAVMVIYSCYSVVTDIKLNEEHSEYLWVRPTEAIKMVKEPLKSLLVDISKKES